MPTGDIIGTWFPSGYYGHYRSRTRNDILQEYRHAATPVPPPKFSSRVVKSPDKHLFSNHDNKHSFPTDASYFDTGLGKRKASTSVNSFNPEVIAWMPHKEEISKAGSVMSLYRIDFRAGCKEKNFQQRLSPRIRHRMSNMEADDARLKWISDYKRQYSHGQPNPRINTDFCTGLPHKNGDINQRSHRLLNTTGRLPKSTPTYEESGRRRTKSAPLRYSVGDCLVWNGGADRFTGIQRQMQATSTLRTTQPAMNTATSMTPAATSITTYTPLDVPPTNLPTIKVQS